MNGVRINEEFENKNETTSFRTSHSTDLSDHRIIYCREVYFFLFRSNNPSIEVSKELQEKSLERPIDVIYRPHTFL
jgi:hypothetical protein